MSSAVASTLGTIGLWLCLVIFCCSGRAFDTKSHTVVYRIEGDQVSSRSASLTYSNVSGDTEQIDTVMLPYEKTFEARSGAFLYVSAQNKADSGSIRTTIIVDGKPMKQSTSSGGYVIATASMTCCE